MLLTSTPFFHYSATIPALGDSPVASHPTWQHHFAVDLAVLCLQLEQMVLRVFSDLNDFGIPVPYSSHLGSQHEPSPESQLQLAVSVISYWPATSISTEKGSQLLFISALWCSFPWVKDSTIADKVLFQHKKGWDFFPDYVQFKKVFKKVFWSDLLSKSGAGWDI